MDEDVKGIFNFKGIEVCNARETLEPSICEIVTKVDGELLIFGKKR